MGATQSLVSTEVAATAAALVVAVGLGYATMRPDTDESPESQQSAATQEGGSQAKTKSKKGKKKGKTGLVGSTADVPESGAGSEARVVPFPSVIPGQFDASVVVGQDLGGSTESQASKMKKNKKKKGKVTPAVSEPDSAPVPPSSKEASSEREKELREEGGEATARTRSGKAGSGVNARRKQPEPSSSKRSAPAVEGGEEKLVRPLAQSTASLDTDGSWTRVDTHKSRKKLDLLPPSVDTSTTTSDAGHASATGEESSVADQDVADSFLLTSDLSIRTSSETRKTLAEKLLPKPVKTNVDDMLDGHAAPTLARVMRIQPLPHEKPAQGFSWADYEDVRDGENDADGEDDGWGVVASKKSNRTPRPVTTSVTTEDPNNRTKRQRQNDKRKELEQASKGLAEKERLERLANHRRELEKTRIAEQYSQKKGSGKVVSGGMSSSVDSNGKLVWE